MPRAAWCVVHAASLELFDQAKRIIPETQTPLSQNHTPNTQAKKEAELLAAIRGLSRREAQNPAEAQARVRTLIGELEAAKGIPKPARAPQVRLFCYVACTIWFVQT